MSGVNGLGASFGRIEFDYGLDTTMIKAGPLAASVLDSALIFSVISKNSKDHFYSKLYDRSGRHTPPRSHLRNVLKTKDLSDVRIGVFDEWFDDSDKEVRDTCRGVLKYLESRGATVVPIKIPHLRWMSLSHGIKIASEFALGWDSDRNSVSGRASIEPNTKITLGLGNSITALEALAADKIRAWTFDYVNNELFGKLNLTIIANPTIPTLPPILSEGAKEMGESNTALVVKLMKYIFMANFLGLPGYSVPVGYVNTGTSESSILVAPVGFHMMANTWNEHSLIRLAFSIEEEYSMNGRAKAPSLKFYDPLVGRLGKDADAADDDDDDDDVICSSGSGSLNSENSCSGGN